MSSAAMISAVRIGAAVLSLLVVISVLRTCDRHDGALTARLEAAEHVADSLRTLLKADSARSVAAREAAGRTRAPHLAAIAHADTADAKGRTALTALLEAQRAAKRVTDDSLSSVLQLVAGLRALNAASDSMARAYLAERDTWQRERTASLTRIASFETAAAADSVEKDRLRETLGARERELAAQGKALRCRIGPFPCPSRLSSALLGAGVTLATVAAIAF